MSWQMHCYKYGNQLCYNKTIISKYKTIGLNYTGTFQTLNFGSSQKSFNMIWGVSGIASVTNQDCINDTRVTRVKISTSSDYPCKDEHVSRLLSRLYIARILNAQDFYVIFLF